MKVFLSILKMKSLAFSQKIAEESQLMEAPFHVDESTTSFLILASDLYILQEHADARKLCCKTKKERNNPY